ncbi:hypothetical protein LMH87_010365 [Akanthomyces muscarius]|uniref:poly(ADP-ribose) glycohydrolase n=1 Tax=Akanthomyces muscarius TaxID=2231603 RepID=A0A9W8QFW8_AKAMU|nr:hypothetical protein LMH87_010365 [Akanthomyces muscarius]KAJ4153899.1 hypothetical protein LMH87_010365 [Akanthomyces muscarius]
MRQHFECVLPCALSCRVIDRFSVLEDSCEDSDGSVPFWLLLKELLRQNITAWPSLLDLLETISVTLRGSTAAAGDYGSLRLAIANESSFFTDIWPSILRFAVALPKVFTSETIPKLAPGQTLSLSQSQCASLLAHQFLCSFESPRPDFYDFSVWYDSSQRHPLAVSAYLHSLFTYFRVRGTQTRSEVEVKVVEYSLWSAEAATNPDQATTLSSHCWETTQLSKIGIRKLTLHSTEFHNIEHLGNAGAVVISANKDIGFGQSATQEELHVGAAPESCVAVLFTPQLKDEQALSINSAQPIIQFKGQRRDISWKTHDPLVAGGRLLFMDALEIDLADPGSPGNDQNGDTNAGLLPDLAEKNMERELKKAFAGFTSWPLTADSTVVTGFWGCGAFNGEPTVKLLLLWMAASLARRNLRVVFDEAEWEYGSSFEKLIEWKSLKSVADVMCLLRSVPKSTRRLDVMQWLNDNE